jgi:molecular chaperone DnaK
MLKSAITEAKSKLTSESLDEIKAATERLQNASHAIAQDLYQQPGAEGQPGAEECWISRSRGWSSRS